jgi:hypothetical protein
MMLSFPSNRNHVAGWYGVNERIEALKKLDFFVYPHWNFSNPTVPYADIVLPIAQQYLEEQSHCTSVPNAHGFVKAINGGCQNAIMYARGGGDLPGEVRPALWIQRELAERIGVGDKVLTRFAGVSYEDFPDAVEAACADAWEDWRKMPAPYGGADHNPPTWEEFRKHPIFMVPREDYHVFMKKNIETDAPLATDSGKIEFYSQWLANADLKTAIHHGGKCFGNGSLPPIARYRHTPEGVHSAKTKKFPMYMVTPHSLFRHHTAYDHNRWFRDEFAQMEMEVGKSSGLDAYDLLGQEAEKVAAGCEGLVMLPHLQGAMAPEANPEAKGVFYGFTLRHGRSHFARAIMESVCFIVRRNIEVIEGMGVPVKEIRALGGGARSRVWKQIEADVTGRPVLTTMNEEAATLGAAILAGKAVGLYSTVEEAVGQMVQIKESFEPTRANLPVYDSTFRTYVDLYNALCPLFAKGREG